MVRRIASFKPSDSEPRRIPHNDEPSDRDGLRTVFGRIVQNDIRVKPSYTDCWVMNPSDGLEVITEYRTDYCGVTVGKSAGGETEYNVTPLEYCYSDELNSIVMEIIESVRSDYRRNGGRLDRDSVTGMCRSMVVERMDSIIDACGSGCDTERLTDDICSIVYRYSIGAGVFEILLTDRHIEDVYLDAPCDRNRIYVTVNGIEGVNSHIRCKTNLMVEKREVANLVNILKRSSGLRYCQSNPVLETDFPEFDARATVVGYPMSPDGDAVAIRKHSVRPWTLSRMIFNGTIDVRSAGILSFLVDNRCTFLICGPRGSGKSSLLSALLFEFPTEQRILTIEDTVELPGEMMRRMGYKVQSILIDDRMGGNQQSRSDEALRLSLRMGESAIVLGEVRGEEARTLYQSMRAGRAGSSIMGTIHGDSADSVYKRVVSDMGVTPEAFSATDIIVTLGTVRDRRSGRLIRRMNELVATCEEPGAFTDISDSGLLFSSPMMRRIMQSSQMNKNDISKEIRARSLMRAILAELAKDDERYLDPGWIVVANETLAGCDRGMSADAMANEFRRRVTEATRWTPAGS